MGTITSADRDLESKERFKRGLDQGFCYACKKGHMDVVKMLIQQGVRLWNVGLMEACEGGHLDIVELMIEKGADYWNRGLYKACEGGHLNIAKLMIEKGATDFALAFRDACEAGHLNIAKFLIEYGANNWNYGLCVACDSKQLHIIKLMIEKGANELYDVFEYAFDIIDSDTVDLIVEKKIYLKPYLKYPMDRTKIFRLYELGLPIDNLKDITGFKDLIKDMEKRQIIAKRVLSNYLIKDLVEIVAGYGVN